MSDILLYGILLFNTFLLLTDVGIVAYFFLRKKKQKEESALVVAEELLSELDYEIREDNEHWTGYGFDFGSYRFILRVPHKGFEAQLYFLGFFSTNAEDISFVRYVTNAVNSNAISYITNYQYSDDRHELVVHASTIVLLNEGKGVKDMFFNRLASSKDLQREFVELYEQVRRDFDSEGKPIEEELIDLSRELYLLREHEIALQPLNIARTTKDYAPTIAELLNEWEPTQGYTLDSLTIHAKTATTITDKAVLQSYALTAPIIGTNELGEAYLLADSITLLLQISKENGEERDRQNVMLLLENDGFSGSSYYIRATICKPTAPLSRTEPHSLFTTEKNSLTVLTAYDISSAENKQREVEYIYNELLEKQASGNSQDYNATEQLLLDITDTNCHFAAYWGMRLFREGRFLEASRLLKSCWYYYNAHYDAEQLRRSKSFAELSLRLGICHLSLQNFEKAYYALDYLTQSGHINVAVEYVNCLVNLGDARGYEVIDRMKEVLEEHFNDSDEYQHLTNFLKRSIVRLHIQRQQTDRAREDLKKMLDEPDNYDFALETLAHIERQSGKQQP